MHWLLNHLDFELFHLGETSVTPLSLIVFTITILLTLLAARLARAAVGRVFRRQGQVDEGTSYAVGRILQYAIIIAGALLGLENVGVSITAFAALGAILSVGIGFGLQNIAQNFISGLILLIERPVQTGDVLQLQDGLFGQVTEIEMRATRIVTPDGISVLVPNSKLISEDVRNLHAPKRTNRLRVGVGVAYGSDTAKVREVLLEVGKAHDRTVADPEPRVFFQSFGDSSLDFELAVWLRDAEMRMQVASDLRFAIDAAFREHGITIPFPQRDLHLVSGFDRTEAA